LLIFLCILAGDLNISAIFFYLLVDNLQKITGKNARVAKTFLLITARAGPDF